MILDFLLYRPIADIHSVQPALKVPKAVALRFQGGGRVIGNPVRYFDFLELTKLEKQFHEIVIIPAGLRRSIVDGRTKSESEHNTNCPKQTGTDLTMHDMNSFHRGRMVTRSHV